ncbi:MULTISPECIES: hypothetical protein [Faecalispora]|uniref:hypothetical protein n=1 Tax=Faecalispora TaxID=3115229 RepID=UPI0024B8872D|nr:MULTISPECIES: hypothetical protein [Faecalispora]
MKKRKEFLLDESTLEYLQRYRDEKHLPSLAAALAGVVDDHKHKNDVPATRVLVESLAKQVAEELKDPLTRIRLGSNNADRNSEVILLLLNSLLSYSGFKTLIDKETPQLTQARQTVKDRIANFRQKKLDKAVEKNRVQVEPSLEAATLSEDEFLL